LIYPGNFIIYYLLTLQNYCQIWVYPAGKRLAGTDVQNRSPAQFRQQLAWMRVCHPVLDSLDLAQNHRRPLTNKGKNPAEVAGFPLDFCWICQRNK
jgi:hypothetical protein